MDKNQNDPAPAGDNQPPAAPALAAPVDHGDRNRDDGKIGEALKSNSTRAAAILDLGQQFGCIDAARSAIANNVSLEKFISDIRGKQPEPKVVQADPLGWSEKEAQKYDLTRAMKLLYEGKHIDGLEGEVSRAIMERSNKHGRGLFLPNASDLAQFSGERATLQAGG